MFPAAPAAPAPQTVLVADDDRLSRERLAALLRGAGYVVEEVRDGQEAVERAARGGVSLVLLDNVMPRMTGLEACRLLKALDPEVFLPVILLTVRADVDARVEGLRLGADDFVAKPYDERELLARVGAMLRIKSQADVVREAHKKLEQLATHDELTGLYNFRYLSTRLAEEWKRAERFHEPLSVLMVDLDDFKHINDTYGHAAGDTTLRQLAARLRRAVRDIDVVARYGGDEFVVLLPNTHLAGAIAVADRLWREVRTSPVSLEAGASLAVTTSIGVAAYPSRDVREREVLLKRADEALYEAKHRGKDRVFVAANQGYLYAPGERGPAAPPPPGQGSGEREPTG